MSLGTAGNIAQGDKLDWLQTNGGDKAEATAFTFFCNVGLRLRPVLQAVGLAGVKANDKTCSERKCQCQGGTRVGQLDSAQNKNYMLKTSLSQRCESVDMSDLIANMDVAVNDIEPASWSESDFSCNT